MSADPALSLALRATIRRIPRGKVATYGQIAAAAGYPGYARHVAATLRAHPGLPWQRVVGHEGRILLRGESGFDQRIRLESEGVTFVGRRVNLAKHQYRFPMK